MRIAFASQREYFAPHLPDTLIDHEVIRINTSISSSEADYDKLLEFKADINILFRPEHVPDAVLARLGGQKVGISSEPFPKIIDGELHYSNDSLGRFGSFLPALKKNYDHIFHYDPSSKSFLEKQGIRLSGYFPLPVKAPPPPPIAQPIDLLFLGRSTIHRERMLGVLKRDFNLVHIAHGLHGAEVSDFIHRARIILNIHAEDEISWEPRIQLALAHRKLVLSEPIGPNSILEAGVHFIEVKTAADLVGACKHALAEPARFENVVKDGFETTLLKLDAQRCFAELVERLNKMAAPSFSQNDELLNIVPLVIAARYNGMGHLIKKWLQDV